MANVVGRREARFLVPQPQTWRSVLGGSKENSSTAPSITKRSTPQNLKLAGQCLLSNNKDLVVPMEATWWNRVDNKWAWSTIIKKQPGANGHHKMSHLTPPEVAVKRATYKSLLNNMYLEGATRNLKGDDEAYKYASRNTLEGILVYAHFLIQTKMHLLTTHVTW
jgi:hypothetical protein